MMSPSSTTADQAYPAPSLWRISLVGDPFTPQEFIYETLIHLFGKSIDDATEIAKQVHETGTGLVGIYTKEIALTRVAQCKLLAEQFGHPLLANAERNQASV